MARIRSIRPSRRAVLRALVIGAAATALVPLDWYLSRRAAAAPADRDPDDKSEHLQCAPRRYDEEANNWPRGGPAVCYGGWRRGRYPCSDGYHVEGRHSYDGEELQSTRLTTNCHARMRGAGTATAARTRSPTPGSPTGRPTTASRSRPCKLLGG